MIKLDKYISPLYWMGVVGFTLSMLVIVGFRIGARFADKDEGGVRLRKLLEIQSEAIALAEPQVLLESEVLSDRILVLSEEKTLSKLSAPEFAMDLTERLLDATRKAERKLTKPKAEALLQVLREELALPPSEQTEESIRAIRARLVSLTEMMVEVQSSLTDVEYKVDDVKAFVDKLPEVLRNQRDHMRSLDLSIEHLIETTATKAELKVLERDLTSVKWATASAIGVLFTIVGWMMSILLPKKEALRSLDST